MNSTDVETQVPGAVPSREEQLAALLAKLAGNQSFRICRGRLGDSPLDTAYKSMPISDGEPLVWTRRGILDDLDIFWGHARVMISLVAQYRRDGWKVAEAELKAALEGRHVIWGETVPIEQTTPITMVMVRPKVGLRLLKWMVTHKCEQLVQHIKFRKGLNEGVYDAELEELFATYPTLEKRTEPWFSGGCSHYWQGNSIFAGVYRDQRGDIFDNFNLQAEGEIGLGIHEDQLETKVLDGEGHYFAYVFIGKDQGEIMSKFKRDDQSDVATWQFDLPTLDIGHLRSSASVRFSNDFVIGLHPEDEHERWKDYNRSYVSKGFSQGFGAIIHRKKVDCGFGDKAYPEAYRLSSRGEPSSDGKLRMIFKPHALKD